MHYITGTQFTINPQLRLKLPVRETNLKTGTTYTLLSIKKCDNMYIYTFMDRERNKVQIPFTNCREADKLISDYRREALPDYEAYYLKSDSD